MHTRINSFCKWAITAVLLAALSTSAFGIDVNTDQDIIADDGLCSLREAITNANFDSALFITEGECAAGSGTDMIIFTADFTITLGSALPGVTNQVNDGALTIMGNGMANTIIQASTCNPVTLPDGCTPATYRVLEFQNGTHLLQNVTVRHGNCDGACSGIPTFGAGILNTATLTVNNSSIQDNRASLGGGGIFSIGPQLTVDGSKVIRNQSTTFRGGGIGSQNSTIHIVNGSLIAENSAEQDSGGGVYFGGGSALISHSNISDNRAGSGGGIYSVSPLTIEFSTFSANVAHNLGGGLLLRNDTSILASAITDNVAEVSGAGLVAGSDAPVEVSIANSTISANISDEPDGAANKAVGGMLVQSGSLVNLYNVTLFDNHGAYVGGISDGESASVINIYNSIIYNNPGATYDNCYFLSGTLDLAGMPSIFKSSAGCSPVNAAAIIDQDPLLQFLAYNGGPTLNHALPSNSPAVDIGDNSVCADPNTVNNLDQRGRIRPNGPQCDLGAFEFHTLIFEDSFETP